MKALTLSIFLLLPAGPVLAQDIPVEIWLIRTFDDTPLEEAVEFITITGDFKVEIEPGLEAKKVNVSIDAQPFDALKVVVESVGLHLWDLGEKKYAIRSQAPPGEDDAPEGGDEETEPTVPKEPWHQEIRKKLDEIELDLPDGDLPLPEWVADLEKRSGIPLFLDPKAKDAGSGLSFRAKVTSKDKLAVGSALSTLFLTKFVMWDIRWGGVFIAKEDRLTALPKELLPAPAEDAADPELNLREKLRKTVSFRIRKSTLGSAMSLLGRKGGLKIRLDASIPKEIKTTRFSVSAKNRRLDHALAVILLPRGLAVEMDGAGLRVVLAKGK